MEKIVAATWRRAMLLGSLLIGLTAAATAQPDLSVEEILERALQRARQSENRSGRETFQWKSVRTQLRLNGAGEVQEQDTEILRAVPIGSTVFERVLERNGNPLSLDERQKQEKRELQVRRSGGRQEPEARDTVVFDRSLVDRFIFRMQGSEIDRGRLVWKLAFEPRPGKLPNQTRIDMALNNSRGSILVDQQTFEISGVHFELMRPIRIWWGIIGRLTAVTGSIQRVPVGDGVWLPSRVDILFKGRILFSSLHRRILTVNSEFESTNR